MCAWCVGETTACRRQRVSQRAMKQAEDPAMMPYFFLQHDYYITLKERATAHILSGADGAPEGMATIDIAVEALKCAEYLTPMLTAALKA